MTQDLNIEVNVLSIELKLRKTPATSDRCSLQLILTHNLSEAPVKQPCIQMRGHIDRMANVEHHTTLEQQTAYSWKPRLCMIAEYLDEAQEQHNQITTQAEEDPPAGLLLTLTEVRSRVELNPQPFWQTLASSKNAQSTSILVSPRDLI